MQTDILNDILESVDTKHKYFSYQTNDYIKRILIEALKQKDLNKTDLSQNQFGFILHKPAFRQLTEHIGKQNYTLKDLDKVNSNEQKHYKISLGRWGESIKHRNDDYYQTSCPGENLVLQINFDWEHDLLYHHTFNVKEEGHPFSWEGHPIAQKYKTMAWARIDLDLESEEAFIEEIQNDWLRDAFNVYKKLKECSEKRRKSHWITDFVDLKDFDQYIEYLKPYQQNWSEVTLMAGLDFILNEIGIQKIYYHSFESGNYFKQLRWSKPPKSLYTQLPKRFGFQKVKEVPVFWQKQTYMKKKIRQFNGELYCFDFRL